MDRTTLITLVTDPIADVDSLQVMASLRGFLDVQGSPVVDGTPTGSRSVFHVDDGDLRAGGLDARLDALTKLGIGVHRVRSAIIRPSVPRTDASATRRDPPNSPSPGVRA